MQYRHAVKALITRGDSVLLVREDGGEHASFHTLPGGGVKRDESETDALCRELDEEVDASIEVNDAVATYRYSHRSRDDTSKYQIYTCDLISETVRPQRDEGILDAEWHQFTDLPETVPPKLQTILQDVVALSCSESAV